MHGEGRGGGGGGRKGVVQRGGGGVAAALSMGEEGGLGGQGLGIGGVMGEGGFHSRDNGLSGLRTSDTDFVLGLGLTAAESRSLEGVSGLDSLADAQALAGAGLLLSEGLGSGIGLDHYNSVDNTVGNAQGVSHALVGLGGFGGSNGDFGVSGGGNMASSLGGPMEESSSNAPYGQPVLHNPMAGMGGMSSQLSNSQLMTALGNSNLSNSGMLPSSIHSQLRSPSSSNLQMALEPPSVLGFRRQLPQLPPPQLPETPSPPLTDRGGGGGGGEGGGGGTGSELVI